MIHDPLDLPLDTLGDFVTVKTTVVTHLVDNLYLGGAASGMVLPKIYRHVVSMVGWSYKPEQDLESFLAIRSHDGAEVDVPLFSAVVNWLVARLPRIPSDERVLIHCQQGFNRSSLVAVLLLSDSRARWGLSRDAAIRLIRERRSPSCLYNRAFEAYLRESHA